VEQKVNRTPGEQVDLSFEELAACQGIQPITDFESLLGHPSPGNESPEQFGAMLRAWRREGAVQPQQR
jgi:hypothetical protein